MVHQLKKWQLFAFCWIIQCLLLSASRDMLMLAQFQKKIDVFQSDMELLKFDMSTIQHTVSNLNNTCHCKEYNQYFENADKDVNSGKLVNRQFTDNITGNVQTSSRFSDSDKILSTRLLKAFKDEKKHTREQLDKMLGTIDEEHTQEKIFQTDFEERYHEHDKQVKQMESNISKMVQEGKDGMKKQMDSEIETLKQDFKAKTDEFSELISASQQEKTVMKVEFDNKLKAYRDNIDKLTTVLTKNEQEIKTLKQDFKAKTDEFSQLISASQQEKTVMKVEFDNKFKAYRDNIDKLTTVLTKNEQEISVMKEYIRKMEDKMNILTFLVDKQKALDYCSNPSDDWIPSKELGSSFLIVGTPTTWSQAKEFCLNRCSYLVELTTSEKQTFVQNLYKTKSKNQEFWTGGNDLETEGEWKWYHSGLSINRGFTYWRQGEPNDRHSNENCLASHLYRKWNDLPCNTKFLFEFVCEKRLTNTS